MEEAKCIAKRREYKTNIAGIQCCQMHGIHFVSYMNFCYHIQSDSKPKHTHITIRGIDKWTSKSNPSDLQMDHTSFLLKVISGQTVTVKWKIFHIVLESLTAGIVVNVCSSFRQVSHVRNTLLLIRCMFHGQNVGICTVSSTWVIGCQKYKINFLLEWQLYQSFVHPTRLTGPIFPQSTFLATVSANWHYFKRYLLHF